MARRSHHLKCRLLGAKLGTSVLSLEAIENWMLDIFSSVFPSNVHQSQLHLASGYNNTPSGAIVHSAFGRSMPSSIMHTV